MSNCPYISCLLPHEWEAKKRGKSVIERVEEILSRGRGSSQSLQDDDSMSTFTPITIEEMREVLKAEKGWKELEDTKEHVFEWSLTKDGSIVIRVYTSIAKRHDMSRRRGSDAIRVCAVDLKAGKGYIKAAHVKRVAGWRKNLTSRCIAVIGEAKERLKREGGR